MGNVWHDAHSTDFFFPSLKVISPQIQFIYRNSYTGKSTLQRPIVIMKIKQNKKYPSIFIVYIYKLYKQSILLILIFSNQQSFLIYQYSILMIYALLWAYLSVTLASAMGCQHPVFCNKDILTSISMGDYFSDSKTFVDLTLKVPSQQALAIFQTQTTQNFIQFSFTNKSQILIPVNLSDWQKSPSSLSHIKNQQLKKFSLDLNKRWNQLSRRVNLVETEKCKSDCSSFLPHLNNRIVIVPGGRFQESYYWDTYWILKGLISCGMLETAQHTVENFILTIEKYGFIPNGFRQYYLNRSQPPFFSLMVKQLVKALLDRGLKEKAENLEQKSFPALIKQHQFFMKNHSKIYRLNSQRQIKLNYYNAQTVTPRPQSYRQDLNLVQRILNISEKERILHSLSSMAESGWDFSSRWLKDQSNLATSDIQETIPSDLNTLLGLQELYLSQLSKKFKRQDLFNHFQQLLSNRREYFSQIFNGISFPDYHYQKSTREKGVYPSQFYPFLLFPQLRPTARSIFTELINPPSSQIKNGQQWDKPNVWAPNNWIMHEVLVQEEAIQYAVQWVSTTYCGWKKTGNLYEKYRSDRIGERGQGGQYVVQTGFGWTNGLALYYLSRYGDQIKLIDCE